MSVRQDIPGPQCPDFRSRGVGAVYRRSEVIAVDAEHGTDAAYQREVRAKRKGGPEPCDACKAAHREHVRAKRAAERGEREALAAAGFSEAFDTHAPDTQPMESDGGVPSRLADLWSMRDTLRTGIKVQAQIDPSKLAPLTKELRAVLAEIDQLEDDGDAAVDPFEQFFGEGSNVARFPVPADREAS
jgi:hypothetical protein